MSSGTAQTNSPCDTCAFRTGAGANTEPYNALRAQVCALGGIPFYCHHNFDWENKEAAASMKGRAREMTVCAGWKREVRTVKAHGLFDEFRAIRRAIAQSALIMVEVIVGKQTSKEQRDKAYRRIERCMNLLTMQSAQFANQELDIFG